MLDLYNAINTEDHKNQVDGGLEPFEPSVATQGPHLVTYQDSAYLNDADMVMSFVNLGESIWFYI